MTLGALTASIAHEVNQPLAGIITNASTCLRMLAADPPNLDGARATAQRTLRDGNRAHEVVERLRTLFAHKEPKTEPVDLNDAAREVLALSSSELQRHRVTLQTDFAQELPLVSGDRVQLQQVILNLVLNAADAMKEIDDRPRTLLVATAREDADRVRLSVRDSGVGIEPQQLRQALRGVLHDEEPRDGHRPVDQPLDHREPRRSAVGERQRRARRDVLFRSLDSNRHHRRDRDHSPLRAVRCVCSDPHRVMSSHRFLIADRSTAMNAVAQPAGVGTPAVRPFRVNVPEAELEELRRRIKATRVARERTGRPTTRRACRSRRSRNSRATGRRSTTGASVEARINATPNFITEIDGLDIHFIHVRSKHENALPLIVTHGWPGSIVEQLKIIDPLINPTAHGGSAADAFHVVIPSMPGYGFSGKPTATGWDPARIARAWAVLMKRLGYTRYVAQGGDWGAIVTDLMAAQAPPGVDRHSHQHCRRRPARHRRRRPAGAPAAGRSLGRREAARTSSWCSLYKNVSYAFFMGSRPQTLYGIADSPVGLAAFTRPRPAQPRAHRAVFDGEPKA